VSGRRWPPEQLADPIVASAWVAGALGLVGFVVLALGWRGAAATLDVPVQVPYLVSGGIGGLGLVIAAAALLNTQVSRHLAAQERARLDALIAEAGNVLEAMEA
jgi:hypothetical protein